MNKAEVILANWNRFEQHRMLWEPVWQELSEYIQPRKSTILTKRTPGQRLTDKLFDSVGVHSNELLAASMQGSLTSSAMSWFGMRIRALALDADHPIRVWLEACSEIMHDQLRQSNFSSETHEVYSDLGCFGTGALYEDELPPQPGQKFTGLRFTSIHPGAYCIDEDAEGRVNLFYWKQSMSAQAAEDFFGKENISEEVARALVPGKGDPMERFEFIHAVYPARMLLPTTGGSRQRCLRNSRGRHAG